MENLTSQVNDNFMFGKISDAYGSDCQSEFTYTIIDDKEILRDNSRGLEVMVTRKLKEFGMPFHLKGYKYIITSVKAIMADESLLDGVTKVLYPKVAKIHNSTPQRVEKAIRNAIEVTWSGNNDILINEFKFTCSKRKNRPTNSEFIATLCNLIKLSL